MRLRSELRGRQLIVVSHREPVIHETTADGDIVARHPVSGVVTALDPLLRALGGTWIARASGNADRISVDLSDHVAVGDEDGRYTLRRVWLTRSEERGHYEGFSNAGLWPLCHLAFETPRFRRGDWIRYEAVNRRFADAVVSEAEGPDPIVFVQDYQFALLPRLIRERLPEATIAAFWHIPWPNRSRFERCPYGDAIVEAMRAADVIGFQTDEHARHFLECGGAAAAVSAFPISVELPGRWARSAPPAAECRRAVSAELDLPAASPIVVSVDRLDYTKGIAERLAAIRRVLSRSAGRDARPVFVQVAAPTRTGVDGYRAYAETVRAQVCAINARYGEPGYVPVVWVERHVEPADVVRLYRAADACHVNSLDDGMNLVSKEFVAAREDERGALVLSRFTGAARELDAALLVNPYDVDGAADTILDALRMPPAEQAIRMRRMRACLRQHTVFDWAESILIAAASAREQSPEIATVFPA